MCKYLCKFRQVTEAAVHSYWNGCFTDFGKFPQKQPWWSPILGKLQALQFY